MQTAIVVPRRVFPQDTSKNVKVFKYIKSVTVKERIRFSKSKIRLKST